MSIQLPDGSVVSNYTPGWEKNLPQWYIDGYKTGLFNEDNNWGHDFFPQTEWRGPTKRPPVIAGGPSMVPGYPTTKGTIHHSFPEAKKPSGNSGGWGRHFDREGMAIPESGASSGGINTPMLESLLENERLAKEKYDDKGLPRPSLTERIKDYFKRVESGETEAINPSTNWDEMFPGWEERANPKGNTVQQVDPQNAATPRPEGLQRVGTGIADWFTGNKFDFDQRGPGKKFLDLITKGGMKNKETGNTVAQDLAEKPPVPPIDPEKVLPPTLRKRVYDRDQIKRVPNELGQLYADKDDPDFIDPRIQGNGMMTMQYIPELDNPNWTPENPYDGVGQFGSGTLPM